jgi:hypothetical protein
MKAKNLFLLVLVLFGVRQAYAERNNSQEINMDASAQTYSFEDRSSVFYKTFELKNSTGQLELIAYRKRFSSIIVVQDVQSNSVLATIQKRQVQPPPSFRTIEDGLAAQEMERYEASYRIYDSNKKLLFRGYEIISPDGNAILFFNRSYIKAFELVHISSARKDVFIEGWKAKIYVEQGVDSRIRSFSKQ